MPVTSRTEEHLVVLEMRCSYIELCWLISRMQMIRERRIPREIIRNIASFCTVERVKNEEVTSVRASSSDNLHDLQESLTPNQQTWWMSGSASMRNGRGEEFIEYELSKTKLCRLSKFQIEIPPLPAGPLSVRELRLDCMSPNSGLWTRVARVSVQNISGWQTFQLDHPVDTRYCRVVCLTNQISQFIAEDNDDLENLPYNSVGFYCVRFE